MPVSAGNRPPEPDRFLSPAPSPSALEAEQTDRLHAVLAWASGPGTFYAAAFPPGSAPRLDALRPLGPEALAAEAAAHPPFGRVRRDGRRLVRVGLVRAPGGRRWAVGWTEEDLAEEAALACRALGRAGLGRRSRVSDCLPGALAVPGTLALIDALDRLDAVALPVGPVTDDAAWARVEPVWEIVRPEALAVGGATLAYLASRGRTPPAPLIAVLTPWDRGWLAAPFPFEGLRVLAVPGIANFVAGECPGRRGFHLAADAVVAEILHPEAGHPQPPGAAGRLVLSGLALSTVLLRFDTGLTARIDSGPCPCGDAAPRLWIAP